MKKFCTMTLSEEELDTLLEAVKTAREAERRSAEGFEEFAKGPGKPEARQAAAELAEMFREEEGVYKAIKDKLREIQLT